MLIVNPIKLAVVGLKPNHIILVQILLNILNSYVSFARGKADNGIRTTPRSPARNFQPNKISTYAEREYKS